VKRPTLSKLCGRRPPGTGRPARAPARRSAELPVVFGAAAGGGGAGVPHQGLQRLRSEGHALFPASLASSRAPGSPAGGAGRRWQRPGGGRYLIYRPPLGARWPSDPYPTARIKQETQNAMDVKRTQLQRRTVLCGRRRRFSGHAAALRRARAGDPACNVSSACFFPCGKLDALAFFSIVDILMNTYSEKLQSLSFLTNCADSYCPLHSLNKAIH